MSYVPPRRTGGNLLCCAVPGAVALCFFTVSQTSLSPRWLWQLLTVIFLAVTLSLLNRYLLCSYRYTVENGKLAIVRVQGKRELRVCLADLGDLKKITDREGFEALKSGYRLANFTVNFHPVDPKYLMFDSDGEKYALIVETDPAFLDLINKK